MLDLTGTREAIAADVRAAFVSLDPADRPTVYPYVPTAPAYPAAMLLEDPGDFISPGTEFGSLIVKWRLLLLEKPSPSNEQLTRAADVHLSLLLVELLEYAPTVTSYEVASATSGQPYLSIPITLTTNERL